ncbi:MAG: F0F1 ATP synthase subunit delta [bacterium]|nr:F0F1 ATP synthase subunit delta [bacterium]
MRYTPQQYAQTLRALVEENPRDRKAATRQFAQTLASQNALSLLPDIIREYEQGRLREKGVKRVVVYTPERETGLKHKFGVKAEVVAQSDVRLLGGVVIESGDVRVDNSIKMRMERIKEALLK